MPYAFLAPAITLFILFLIVPIGYTGYISLQKIKLSGSGLGRGARSEVFAGLENYRGAIADPELWGGVLRVLLYGVILVPTMLGLALLFALLLDARRVKYQRFSRISIFLPFAIPGVIATLLWGFLYLPSVSPLHYLLRAADLPQPDLLAPRPVFGAVANIALWGGVGFNMLVIYTALRAIPPSMYESARIDGCTETQIAYRIKIPLVMPALVMTTIFSVIATLQVFAEPYTLRPLTNSLSTTWTPMMKIHRDAFARGDIYAAAATSILVALVTLVFSFAFLRLAQSRTGEQDQ